MRGYFESTMLTLLLVAWVSVAAGQTETEGSLRLSGGASANAGRLEIFHNGQWGTVCDDYFGLSSATVACRSLGFGDASGFSNGYGAGTGQIWLDNVLCVGTESSIVDCPHNEWGDHNCGHYEDVSISCSEGNVPEESLRLSGGSSANAGRLEIFHSGQWGTVCQFSFNDNSATVACRILGFGSGSVVSNQYGAGTGQIWLEDVRCLGLESSIRQCTTTSWGPHNCIHAYDVAISCSASTPYDTGNGTDGSLRLSGGSTSYDGRLEILHGGLWGTICDDYFDINSATVACRSLGFGAAQGFGNQYGSGRGNIWLDDVRCVGNEGSIVSCPRSAWGVHNCVHYEDISVTCSDEWTCEAGHNPCTKANAAAGKFYFKYITQDKYVQCDAFGHCWEKPCAPGTKWSQKDLTCIFA